MREKIKTIVPILLALCIFTFIGIKNHLIMKYGIIYFTILFGALFYANVFKKKIEQTIVTSFLTIMLVMYVFGLIGKLKLGIYFIVLLFNLLGIISSIIYIKKRKWNEIINKIYSSGNIFFTILYIVFAITTFNKAFSIWDEFINWSMVNKNMVYLNDFITNPNSTAMFSSPSGLYPPFPTILQYFFCKILGVYSQGIELFAINMLGFSFMLNIFKNLNTKKATVLASIIFIIMAIPAIFCDSLFYLSVYVDTLIGMKISFIFFEFFSMDVKDKFKWLELIFASVALAFTKSTGIFILVILCFTLLIYVLISNIKDKKRTKEYFISFIKDKNLYLIISMLIVGIIFCGSWQIYTRYKINLNKSIQNENVEEADAYIGYDGNPITYIFKVFFGAFLEGNSNSENMNMDMQSVGNMAKDFFDKDYYSGKPFNMSASTWMGISLIFLIIIYKLINDKEEKRKFKKFSICITIGEMLYMAFLQTAYIIVFHNLEGISHASLQRYLGSYLMAVVIFEIYIFIDYMNRNKIKFSQTYFIILAAIVFIFTPMQVISNATLSAGVYNQAEQKKVLNDRWVSDNVKKLVKDTDKIYPVHQTGTKDSLGLRFRYYMTPIKTANIETFSEENKRFTFEKWKKILYNDYDYVFVIQPDEYFIDNYKTLFENEEVAGWSLYKVEKENGIDNLKLIKIEF